MTEVSWDTSAWPVDDQTLWMRMTTRIGPLDPGGELTHLRAISIHNIEVAYGRWLAWLGKYEPDALGQPPLSRVTSGRVQHWIENVHDCAPNSIKMWVDGLISFLTAADSKLDIRFLRNLQRNLLRLARDNHGDRKIRRIPSSFDLIEAAVEYADDEVAASKSPFEHARVLRDATMIVFLAMIPIRRHNFVSLELGRTILVSDEEITVVLQPEEVKNKTHFEMVLREPGATLMRRYLEEARPFLLARATYNTNALWLADSGLPYSYSYIGRRIPLITQRLIGVKVPPHFFRDAMATTLARASPEFASGTKAILGHSDHRTAERHYNHARSVDAGRKYANILQDLLGAMP
jgi:integrase/recombinase XerD